MRVLVGLELLTISLNNSDKGVAGETEYSFAVRYEGAT